MPIPRPRFDQLGSRRRRVSILLIDTQRFRSARSLYRIKHRRRSFDERTGGSPMTKNEKKSAASALAVLVSLFVSSCVSSQRISSDKAVRTSAPWARDLNEPPPTRVPGVRAASADLLGA